MSKILSVAEALDTLDVHICGCGGMVDTPALGAGAVRRESSSLFIRTNKK